MDLQILANRLEILEQRVRSLEELPDRVDALESQISQFREEVRVEFSATRSETRTGEATLRKEMHAGWEMLRGEMRAGDEKLREEMHAGWEMLRAEMRTLNNETQVFMRVLHEDVLSRFALLDERWNGRKRSRRTSGRTNHKRRSKKG